jgi:hypothetical protein
MNGPEVYAVIFALGPSKRDVNVIWSGSDDGLIQVTRDGGKTWTNVTPKDMPDFGRVSIIDPSAFDVGTAYVAVKRPLLDDPAPYIFRTHDFGKTWTKVVNGIRGDDWVHAVREDPTRRGLLYAATQHGVYISYDDGDRWESLSLNLPDLPVSDLIVEENALAISTMGRGFYILDNITPIRQWSPAVSSAADAFLFAPPPAIRSTNGATISYLLKHAAQRVTIDILDSTGKVVRTYQPDTSTGRGGGGRGGRGGEAGEGGGGGGGRGRGGFGGGAPSRNVGLNTFVWDLRYPGPTTFPGMILWGGNTNGPAAPPGAYRVRLTVDGKAQTQPFVVKRNPLFAATEADMRAQFALSSQIRDKVSEANQAIVDIRRIKTQAADRQTKSSDAKLKETGDRLTKNLSGVEEEIYQVRNQSGQDPLNFPIKVNNRLASLFGVVERGDGRPIASAYPIFQDLTSELKVQTDRLQRVLTTDLTAFNNELRRLGLETIPPKGPVTP